MTAVLTPITRAAPSSSGPPELPGLSATSVWITSSIIRPPRAGRLRPSALTMPAVTVKSKPSGLPTATASWPGCSAAELPSVSAAAGCDSMRSTAMSVEASRPTSRALPSVPSAKAARNSEAPSTTCALVSAKPSGVNRKPEPLPCPPSRPRGPARLRTLICATAALAVWATGATVAE